MISPTDSVQAVPNIRAVDYRQLLLATSGIVTLGWIGDFLFWGKSPGLSVGIFFLVLAIALIVIGKRTSYSLPPLGLLIAACVQSAIEVCFTNIASLLVLTIALFGETAFSSLASKWPRWSEAAYAVLSGPLRWNDFIRSWMTTPWWRGGDSVSSPTFTRLVKAAVPASILALVFAILLSKGNAILAQVFARLGTSLKAWLFDVSFGRTVMWLLWLTVGIVFLWPRSPSEKPRWWTRSIPQWNRDDERLARWQSAMALGAVNVLFFAANTIDVLYLWADGKLPAGVGYSAFVHQGVYSLIAAVLLAAATLAVLFHQQSAIARNPILKGLALLWIGQNIVLILGVLRRLQLYVEAYQLSELRVYVACFLALTTCGFILLAREIWRGMELRRLFFANSVATFVLFFTLQFCDVGTWVANWNVERWIKGDSLSIDLQYLASLGPKGWPGLSKIVLSRHDAIVCQEARFRLQNTALGQQELSNESDWRAFQGRTAARRAELIAQWKP